MLADWSSVTDTLPAAEPPLEDDLLFFLMFLILISAEKVTHKRQNPEKRRQGLTSGGCLSCLSFPEILVFTAYSS